MEYDVAICYFGMLRSIKYVCQSHEKHIFNVLKSNTLKYKIFMHTWSTDDMVQRILCNVIATKIEPSDYKHIHPDEFICDNQSTFLKSVNMDLYFYKDIYAKKGIGYAGEWEPKLIENHICALESMKRCFTMVENHIFVGNTFKFIMFIRPDVMFSNDLQIERVIANPDTICLPNRDHFEGYNDRFAMLNFKNAALYGKRIDEIALFRKYGRIVSEKFVKYIIDKYKLGITFLDLNFEIYRI